MNKKFFFMILFIVLLQSGCSPNPHVVRPANDNPPELLEDKKGGSGEQAIPENTDIDNSNNPALQHS